jgi:formylglycine-generating enzyme required for sulfatase activity
MYPGTPPPLEIWPMNDFEKNLPHHEMLWVEGGLFWMGSDDEGALDDEKPVHEVSLTSFCMGRFPVTQAFYMAIMEGANPSSFQGENRPVEQVSWEDAKQFIQKLNEKTGRTQQRWQYALPSEAQWEYAARGGKATSGTKYAGSDKLKEVGWFEENSHEETKPVGLKLSNALGLYDMSGNVWEWCEDYYTHEYYQDCDEIGVVINPEGPDWGRHNLFRGGSWYDDEHGCRITYRFNWESDFREKYLGFRLALVPK